MKQRTKSDLDKQVAQAVKELTLEEGKPLNVFHPEIGWVVKNGLPTQALYDFFRDLERKMAEHRLKIDHMNETTSKDPDLS